MVLHGAAWCGTRLPVRCGEMQRCRAIVASHVRVGPPWSEQRGQYVEGAGCGGEEEQGPAIVQRCRVHVRPEAKAEGDAVEECCRLMPLAAVGGSCGEQRGSAAGEVRLLQAAHLVSAVGAVGG